MSPPGHPKLGTVLSEDPKVLHFAHGISHLRRRFGEFISPMDHEMLEAMMAERKYKKWKMLFYTIYRCRARIRLPAVIREGTEEEFMKMLAGADAQAEGPLYRGVGKYQEKD